MAMATPAIADWIDCRPHWCGIRSAGEALGLRQHEMLHAGPPLADPRRPPRTLLSSIVMSCLHEGWAADAAAAESMVLDGTLRLAPAQAHRCVTPLAAVISAATPLFEVADRASPAQRMHAPVSTVRGADTRMGFRDPALLSRLRQRDERVAPALQRWVETHDPLDLWPIALQGLAGGDDLHGSTAVANRAFAAALRQSHGASDRDFGAELSALIHDIEATPLFFLTLWMAASACMLRAAERDGGATLVTRAGGNGQLFGIALADDAGRWTCCDAAPPSGPLLPSVGAAVPGRGITCAGVDAATEGAIGDSAVIDMLGFGGQRLAHAPDLRLLFKEHPAAGASLDSQPPERLLARANSLLPAAWPLGVDAAAVATHQQSPRVVLAMLASDGIGGLRGRGIYQPPVDLFERALKAHD